MILTWPIFAGHAQAARLWAIRADFTDEFRDHRPRVTDLLDVWRHADVWQRPLPHIVDARGVATVRVSGIVTRHRSPFAYYVGGVDGDGIVRALMAANADSRARVIVLHVDQSPGGQWGTARRVGQTIRHRIAKPLAAFIERDASAESFALASQCPAGVYAAPTATVAGVATVEDCDGSCFVVDDAPTAPPSAVAFHGRTPIDNADALEERQVLAAVETDLWALQAVQAAREERKADTVALRPRTNRDLIGWDNSYPAPVAMGLGLVDGLRASPDEVAGELLRGPIRSATT